MLDDPSTPTPTERQEWSTAPCGTHPPSVGASGRRLRDSSLTGDADLSPPRAGHQVGVERHMSCAKPLRQTSPRSLTPLPAGVLARLPQDTRPTPARSAWPRPGPSQAPCWSGFCLCSEPDLIAHEFEMLQVTTKNERTLITLTGCCS